MLQCVASVMFVDIYYKGIISNMHLAFRARIINSTDIFTEALGGGGGGGGVQLSTCGS